ncbi:MAG: Hpt domain-containing protein [Treponema sp.]|nr:Hpt domain-containing protein [Treponema sp.]
MSEKLIERKTINMEEALERFGGMQDLYDELVQMFLSEHSYSSEKIQSFLNSKNYSELYNMTHKLKGVAGTLGLEKLFDESKNLNDYLKTELNNNNEININETIFTFVEKLKNTFNITINELKKRY